MKKLINVLGLVFGLILVGAGFIIAARYSLLLGFSGLAKSIFMGVAALPGFAFLYIFDGDYQENIQSLIKPVPRTIWLWRIIGAAVGISGIVLVIGNRTGQSPTFPYAGTIVGIAGALIIGFKGSSR